MQLQTENIYPKEQNIEKVQDRRTDEELSKYLLRLSDNIESLDKEKRLSLFRKQIKAHQYFDGNFYGYVDENLEWQSRPRADNETWYSDNQFYSYIRTGLMELNRRNQTKVAINAAYKDEELENAATFAQARYNENHDRTFSAHLKQTENTYALLNGIVYRYTYFDLSGRGEKVPRMTKEKKENKKDGYLCANCISPVAPVSIESNQSDTPCPKCGSTFVQIMGGEDEEIIIGYDDLPSGENRWVSPNPIGIIISMQASTIEESPFLKWKQLILRSVLEDMFKIDLPSTGTSTELRYIGNQQTATPAGYDGDFFNDSPLIEKDSNELELLEFQQHWLDYPVYCKKKFDKPQRMSNGKTLPANVELGKIFPKGLYYARVGELIVNIWNEDKNDKWVSSPYSLRAGSAYGGGTFQSHGDQEILNDFTALKMANAWNNGVLREFVNPDVITELSADPAIPTEFKSVDDHPVIGYGYAQASPATLSPEIYGIEETAKASMQNKIGAMSNGAGGLADTEKWGDTATAISIKRNLAVGRFAPDLELMADNLDKKQAYQFLENEQKFFTPDQWKRVKGDSNAEAVKKFLNINIRRDLTITIVPDSYMPKTESQIIANLMSYAQIAPVLAQMGNEEILSYAGEVFDMPQKIANWNLDKEATGKLLERFEALSESFIAQYGDAPTSDLNNPMVLGVATQINEFSKMPLDYWLDNHQAIIDALKDWRTTDKGRGASNLMLAAVNLRLREHEKGIVLNQQKQTQMMIEGQAPAQDLQEREQMKELAVKAEEQERELTVQNEQNEIAQEQSEQEQALGVVQELSSKEEAEAERQKEIQIAEIESQGNTQQQ